MRIIDAHQHLWDLDMFPYSWCQPFPTLNRSFRLKDYVKATREIDIWKSVHMEADVDEPYMLEETRYALALSDQDNCLEGIVACGRPERPDFRAYLEQFVGHPKLKGIRRVLHNQPDYMGQDNVFIQNVQLLEQYGLSYDIAVQARQLPIAINLVKKCPGVSFILDHCGFPQVKEKIIVPWRQHIEDISTFPNVVCKISGLVAYADPEKWTAEDLRPYVEHIVRCFGWDRVMFGSDWPVCTLSATYREWVEALKFLTRDAGEANQHRLFCENAERIYRLS